ncbi:hypothetical protein L3X38_041478 [Prunus dulcis]|uniref:Uncharacterized protein n=1 Tax=Prunus dulcis TaxID=3755 RepID=A0AAD4UT22_PRUDU|nr:hypothetical protein L3X38_041478 [Prunus dulcis]
MHKVRLGFQSGICVGSCHKTNFSSLLPPMYHKQLEKPYKSRVRSAAEPPLSSNPKDKHLRTYNLETKCCIYNQAGHNKRKCARTNDGGSSSQVPSQRQKKRAPQGNTSTHRVIRQSRHKQASSSTQSRQKQPIISKAKKRTKHHQASSQSNQGPQPSQASRFEEASQFE